jgi:hypothetical protein
LAGGRELRGVGRWWLNLIDPGPFGGGPDLATGADIKGIAKRKTPLLRPEASQRRGVTAISEVIVDDLAPTTAASIQDRRTSMQQICMPYQHLSGARHIKLLLQAVSLSLLTPERLKEPLGVGLGSDLFWSEAKAGRSVVRETMTLGVVEERSTVELNIRQRNPNAAHETIRFGMKVLSITVHRLLASGRKIKGLKGERLTPIQTAEQIENAWLQGKTTDGLMISPGILQPR